VKRTPVPDLSTDSAIERNLRVAARAYGRHGLAHAYGHCSVRLDEARFLVCAPVPMALVPVGLPGTVVPIHGHLPPEALGEVRIHQHIYRRRRDVGAISRTMPPAVMAMGVARRVPRALHGLGSYFGKGPVVWDDPQLVRDDATAERVADTIADRNALVLRGNGLVVAAESNIHALVLTWYLEDAARLELAVRSGGLSDEAVSLDAVECERRATAAGRIFERMWQYLTAGDPEATEEEPA
jgi:HCOMODA/2-hydroxy-3-carboxy-muconic semialdehyde decarboxylase